MPISDEPPDGPARLNPVLVKESFAHIQTVADKALAYFYGRLFAASPEMRALFPLAMDRQRDRFFTALTRIVWSLDSPEELGAFLDRLGRDHRKFGVNTRHYAEFTGALLATVREFCGPAWTEEVGAAWEAMLGLVTATMVKAAEADAGQAPSWWLAEVLGHERRAGDLAVLTVRPDQPFRYQAGQYLSVQTTRWPREWRAYSIANAPRDDGLLILHVRAIDGGLVSNALVHHTAPGDTLLLGPARGTMTLPAGPAGELLCVAGGTGLAPIKAIIEQAARAGRDPAITLLFGARTAAGLYDLRDLRRLAASWASLDLVPAVSGEPGFGGAKGTLPELVRTHSAVPGRDVYVCGPPGMVAGTRAVLAELGVPSARVHYDEPG